jgi:prepilin-type N-terminal cleavage/methylation domain-containing protein
MKNLIKKDGFTIPELIIVMVITGLFSSIIISFAFYFWRYSYVIDYTQESFIQRLNANDYLRDSIGSASRLIIQNSLPDAHANAPDPEITGDEYWKPIHAIPGTYSISNDLTIPLIYYRKHSLDSNGNYILNGTQPYDDEFILYMDSSTKKLLLRSIANTFAPGNALKTTCPPVIADSSCSSDKILMEHIESVGLRYFSRSGNLIDYTSVWDPLNNTYAGPDFSMVEVVELTANVNRKALFSSSQSTKNSTIIRVALRNY